VLGHGRLCSQAPAPARRVLPRDPRGQVLGEIGAGDVPELLAFNKADLAPLEARRLLESHPGSVALSASTGAGVDGLLERLAQLLRRADREVDFAVPYDRGDVLAALHRAGEVLEQRDADGRLALRVRLDEASRRRFSEFALARFTVGDDESIGALEEEQ
jgi:GTPase